MADVLTREQRSYCMSRIKGKDTGVELLIRSALHRRGFRFRTHVTDLPGRPDIVMKSRRLVVFVDGDFWHGRHFHRWENKLSPFWREKIRTNIQRDRKNIRKLRREGWLVVRLWESQIKKDLNASINKIVARAALHN